MVHQNSSRRQLTYEMKTSLVEQIKNNPYQTTKDLQRFFYDKYGLEICQTTLSCILKKEGLGIKKAGGKGRNSGSLDNVSSSPPPQQQQLPPYQPINPITSPSMSQFLSSQYPNTDIYTSPIHDNTRPLTSNPATSFVDVSPLPSSNTSSNLLAPISSTTSSTLSQLPHESLAQLNQFPHLALNQLPNYTFHTPSPIESNFPIKSEDSPKNGYKIYNTNILCNDDATQVLPVVSSNIHNIPGMPNLQGLPNMGLNYGLNNYNFNSFSQVPSVAGLSSNINNYVPPPTVSTAPATPPSDTESTFSSNSSNYTSNPRSQLYDINIINPHVKRFRPSSQYQQLEKVVLKLACDLHREHRSKVDEFKQRQNQISSNYRYNALSPPMNYGFDTTDNINSNDPNNNSNFNTNNTNTNMTNNDPGIVTPLPSPEQLTNSEIVKRIKKEITTSPQYESVSRPIYLNQFIHKCLKRYQFTDELIDRLNNVDPLSMN